MSTRAGRLLACLALGTATELAAQAPPLLRAYYLNVALATDAGPYNAGGALDVQRARAMVQPARGPWMLDVAYEHSLVYTSAEGAVGGFGGLGQARGGTDWLPLQGTLRDSRHLAWRHRLDRASLRYAGRGFEITAGRQTVSWATTLFLTPADPFAPFDPSEPFREYRTGVDALRVRAFPGTLAEIDAVLRPADTPAGTTVTGAVRAKTAAGHWEISGWGGVVHDDPAASLGATLTVAGAVLRAEGVVRQSGGRIVSRVAAGLDRSFALWHRTLYAVVEYQRDEFGAAAPAGLPAVLLSPAAQRNELQALGRDVAAGQVTYQVHPLVSADLLALWDLDDQSVLLTPAVSYSPGGSVTLRLGLFAAGGRAPAAGGLPQSEYGAVPTVAYASLTAFY